MTRHQLQQIEDIAEGRMPPRLTDETLEGLRAILAERAELLTMLDRFDKLDTDPHVTDAEWSQFRRDLHALRARANGGTP